MTHIVLWQLSTGGYSLHDCRQRVLPHRLISVPGFILSPCSVRRLKQSVTCCVEFWQIYLKYLYTRSIHPLIRVVCVSLLTSTLVVFCCLSFRSRDISIFIAIGIHSNLKMIILHLSPAFPASSPKEKAEIEPRSLHEYGWVCHMFREVVTQTLSLSLSLSQLSLSLSLFYFFLFLSLFNFLSLSLSLLFLLSYRLTVWPFCDSFQLSSLVISFSATFWFSTLAHSWSLSVPVVRKSRDPITWTPAL